MENEKVAHKITKALHRMNMKHNLKTLGKILGENHLWYGTPLLSVVRSEVAPKAIIMIIDELHEMEKELREHYKEYKKLKKPPEDDETWYCLQYLELLVEEILGE